MPTTPLSPVTKMSLPSRTSSVESAEAIRKRVCKACDRCRLKKSKCDGSIPCSRCQADNSICVFGERKKTHDKVYPKGYVEMLEQQQSQLVDGLREMYRRLSTAQQWSGPALSEASGHPLTHDILAALNLLIVNDDGSGEHERFEDDPEALQARLLARGAPYVQRRGSLSSDSEHSQHGGHSRSGSRVMPLATHRPSGAALRDALSYTPLQSPLSRNLAPAHAQSAPPSGSPLVAMFDPQFYLATWAAGAQAMLDSKAGLVATAASVSATTDDFLDSSLDWYEPGASLDLNMYDLSTFGGVPQSAHLADGAVSALDPMELDLSRAPPPPPVAS